MNKNGGSFRNYSHLWEDGYGYENASKGEKDRIRAFLCRDHQGYWFASIADTGQLHVLPFAQINGPGTSGVVEFDRVAVEVPADTSLVFDMCLLLTAGATKDEITSGDYGVNAWRRCEPAVRLFEGRHSRLRGGAWFALAIWLAQADKTEVERRLAAEKEARDERKRKNSRGKRKARKGGDRDVPGRAQQSVHKNERTQGTEALAAVPVRVAPEPDRGRDDRAVAGSDSRPAADRSSAEQRQQLSLFDA